MIGGGREKELDVGRGKEKSEGGKEGGEKSLTLSKRGGLTLRKFPKYLLEARPLASALAADEGGKRIMRRSPHFEQ